jgi:hypothetical protein
MKAKAMQNKLRKKSKSNLDNRASSRINIFISYAHEDRELVTSIDSLLRETFEFAPLSIYRDIEIKEGQNWAKQIDTALQETDILLVIFTERMKMSHSYTGYEIGYFNRSIQQRRKGSAGFDRIYIPFCIGADVPDTMHDIQGISIGADEVYKVLKTRIIRYSNYWPVFQTSSRKHLERGAVTLKNPRVSRNKQRRCIESSTSICKVVYRRKLTQNES